MNIRIHRSTIWTMDFDPDPDDGEELELELSHEPVEFLDMYAEKLSDGRILVGYLSRDDDCPHPLDDCDGMGRIYDYKYHEREWKEAVGLHYDSGDRDQDALNELAYQLWPNRTDKDWDDVLRDPQADVTRDNIKRPYRRKWDAIRARQVANGDFGDPDGVVLDRYEHGGVVYHVGYNSNFVDRQWDCSYGGAVWVPDNYLRIAEAKDLVGEERQKKMREWAGQAVEVMNEWMSGACYGVVVELFDAEGEPIDSEYDACWGYIGSDHAEEELKRQIEWHREHYAKESA